ncbi:GNAT family N-acetyltransferase [Treponema brennaborense]|uniref:GCN5-related N-acetyltransferase n=1 Tax=Treponema brennaborense (strain DSM 12168 / CIP 105900 / DD5/3) TaxID=906968 RepID=F4LL42_TREBD|nr:GNAT family N-acetyltransferase [Treponema brennaborense]AEE17616.1 GCN5-related N-acetyltransferase [Treponema brennaborense DSM 12168]
MYVVAASAVPPEQVRAFLSLHEPFCVQLTERFSESDARSYCLIADRRVCGVVFVSKAGLMLHCFPPELSADFCRNAAHVLRCLFTDRSVYCISGAAAGTGILMRAAAESGAQPVPAEVRSYVLMSYGASPVCPAAETPTTEMPTTVRFSETLPASERIEAPRPPEALPAAGQSAPRLPEALSAAGQSAPRLPKILPITESSIAELPVIQCSAADEDLLYPLQRAYDIVEVLPEGRPFSELPCRGALRKALARRRVFGVGLPGGAGFAAKASVSAVSAKCVQIGGVFTVPEHRNKGLAARLVRYIAENAARGGQQAVLFVKIGNGAARAAYAKAGFTECGSYTIAYYAV